MRIALPALALVAALAGCSKDATKTSADLTFFESPTIAPASVVVNQDYVLSFTVYDTDQLSGHIDNVAWTVSRDGVPNVYTGTIATIASHQRVPISIIENQPVGTHTYVITIDPNNTVHELSEDNNAKSIAVTVQALTIE